MSKIAILSDIHANLPAFKAVLREVKDCGADRIVFLGDIVGYGASPAKCVELVRKLGGHCVMGNHDEEIRNLRKRYGIFHERDWKKSGYLAGLALAEKCLNEEQAIWLANLPYCTMIDGAWAAHGSFDHPCEFNYIEDAESAAPTLKALERTEVKLCFCGHTHVPAIFPARPAALEWLDASRVVVPVDEACVVTVGAVGQSREENERRASWVLWDSGSRVVDFRKTEYDNLQAAQDIVKAGLPVESALRLVTDEVAKFLMG